MTTPLPDLKPEMTVRLKECPDILPAGASPEGKIKAIEPQKKPDEPSKARLSVTVELADGTRLCTPYGNLEPVGKK